MTRSRSFRAVLALGVSLALVAAACGDDGDPEAGADTVGQDVDVDGADQGGTEELPEKITFGAVPSEESTSLQQSYEPIIAAIEQELGVEVEFVQATDYAGIIEGMIAGNVDVGVFGPFSYVLAKDNGADIEPVGAFLDAPDAEPGYQSYGITRSDNDEIQELADFAGRSVCFVDPGSTSGFLFPTAGLIEEGVVTSAAESDLAAGLEPTFAGGHDASAIAVANGDCEAGFAYDEMVDTQVIEDGAVEEGALKVVWKSEVIAGSPITISNALPEAFRTAFAELLIETVNRPGLVELGICESEEDCGLTDEDVWGFAAVDDAYYDGVRAVCLATKSPQCEG